MQKIYIAGHTGLVGSALVRHFSSDAKNELIVATRAELDLTDPKAVQTFIDRKKPDIVIIAAGRVGGIQANSKYPASFIYDNIMIETNLIHGAWRGGVKRLLNFGSSCIYPKHSPQPMKPEYLMTGKLEPTNEPYAMAKFAGLSLCDSYNRQYGTSYINAIPSNLYGPGDTFDLERCHVISALIQKFFGAKKQGAPKVILWGSGSVKRDFLFIDDFAHACRLLLESYERNEPINVGAEAPVTIQALALLIAEVVGFKGEICWDTSKPYGAPERTLDAAPIRALGFQPKINLKTGLEKTVEWFKET